MGFSYFPELHHKAGGEVCLSDVYSEVRDNSGDMVLVITNTDVLISHLMDVFGLD